MRKKLRKKHRNIKIMTVKIWLTIAAKLNIRFLPFAAAAASATAFTISGRLGTNGTG